MGTYNEPVTKVELTTVTQIWTELYEDLHVQRRESAFEKSPSISTFPPADWLWDPVTWSWWEILQTVFALLGVVGNLLVMVVLFQRRASRRPADTLIGALAAADLLTSLFMFPHSTPRKVPGTFFGNFVCKLFKSSALLWISCSASIFTLTAISIERCIAVVYPLRAKRLLTRRRVVISIVVIWLCSVMFVGPEFVFHIVEPRSHNCIFQYQSTVAQEIYGIFVISVFFLIPSFVMLIVYILIVATLHKQALRFPQGLRNHHASPACKTLRAKKRAVKLLFIIVAMYVICWAPNTFAYLAVSIHWVGASFVYSPPYEGLVALAFFNSCVNPIIYSIRCPEFRKALLEIFTQEPTLTNRAPLFGQDFNGQLQKRSSIGTIYLTNSASGNNDRKT